MAILHNKEHKIATVIEKLPKKYTEDQFVEKFINLFSKEWGKIKSAYIKQSQDKEPGTVINMPKPDLYLKQLLKNFLRQESSQVTKTEVVEPLKVKDEEPSEKNADIEVEVSPTVKESPKKAKAAVEKPKKVATEKVSKPKK